ncbi:MAG: MFS transporter [Firmicutes bacterium]|nr:MFS transporter [Bacillota bacterium]
MYNVWLLGLVSLLTDISSEMVYPLVPLYLTAKLGATPLIVGLIEGVAESLASLLKVFSGYFSDRLGRRKTLTILGYGSSTVGKALFYLAASWGWVFGGRLVDRFGKGVRTAPRDAIIADSVNASERGRAFGLHRTMDTLGAVLGILLAYYLFTFYTGDYQTVFLMAVIPSIIGVIVLLAVREKRTVQTVGGKQFSLKWSSLNFRLQAFLVVVFLFALGNSSNQFLLLRAQQMGFDAGSVILLYLTYNLVYTVVSYPAGRLSDIFGRKNLLVLGYMSYGLVYLGFARASEASSVWWLFGLYGVYAGATEGVEKALIADIAPAHLRGTLMGLHATLVGIGLLPASLLAGWLWTKWGAAAPFYFGGFMGVLTAVLLWFVLAEKSMTT